VVFVKLSSENIKTQDLSHLGIVAGVIKKIGLIEKIEQKLIKKSNNQKISHGQSAAGMILNGLGFTQRRLYLVSSFFNNKPVDKYLGDGVKASDLSDDTLGRTLDAIYAYGTTKFFGEIAFEIAQEFNFLGRSAIKQIFFCNFKFIKYSQSKKFKYNNYYC
jgi:transposase